MNLNELKEMCEYYIQQGHENDKIIITVSAPSVGQRSGVGIKSIYPGFDWEHGQIRIECDQELTPKNKDRDLPAKAYKRVYTDNPKRKTTIINCPRCENHLRRDDKYCSRCGQAIQVGNI